MGSGLPFFKLFFIVEIVPKFISNHSRAKEKGPIQ
jgi:hypothetical protein